MEQLVKSGLEGVIALLQALQGLEELVQTGLHSGLRWCKALEIVRATGAGRGNSGNAC